MHANELAFNVMGWQEFRSRRGGKKKAASWSGSVAAEACLLCSRWRRAEPAVTVGWMLAARVLWVLHRWKARFRTTTCRASLPACLGGWGNGPWCDVSNLVFFQTLHVCQCLHWRWEGGGLLGHSLSVCSTSSTETLITTISSRLCTHALFVELIKSTDFSFFCNADDRLSDLFLLLLLLLPQCCEMTSDRTPPTWW